jgi:hypothetical protein
MWILIWIQGANQMGTPCGSGSETLPLGGGDMKEGQKKKEFVKKMEEA